MSKSKAAPSPVLPAAWKTVPADGIKKTAVKGNALTAKRETLLSKLKDSAGGISRLPTLDEVLDEITDVDDYETKPNAYHFSNLMRCFRWQHYKGNKRPCDHGLQVNECKVCRFDAGKSKPGVATEAGIRQLYAEILNHGKVEGPILNDMRFSIPIEVSWEEEEESEKKPGKYIVRNRKQVVVLSGKSDTIIQGDNGRIIGFTELKTPFTENFSKEIKNLTKSYGTKRLPLTIAGIKPEGVVSLNQLVQAAVGMKALELNSRAPETGVLQTVSRSNYRDHIEIVITPEEWNLLYDMAIWYVKELHIDMQFDEPPAPEFFLGWECGLCPFKAACAEENKRTDQQRVIHPIVPGLQGRLEALHVHKDAKPTIEAPKAKKARKAQV